MIFQEAEILPGGGRIMYLVTHSLKRMKHKGREAHLGLFSVGAIVLACWSGPSFSVTVSLTFPFVVCVHVPS